MRVKTGLITAALGLALLSAPTLAETVELSPGQPICADQDSLEALTVAALTRRPKPNVPCEGARRGAVAEVAERYPSGADGVRVMKVRVATPGRAPVVGYTLEVGPN